MKAVIAIVFAYSVNWACSHTTQGGPSDVSSGDRNADDAREVAADASDGGTNAAMDAELPESGSTDAGAVPEAREADLAVDTVATGLDVVWEIRFLPDGDLIITERRSGNISRVSITNGQKTVLGTVSSYSHGEGGLMGLALSPTFASDAFVYVCYTYRNQAQNAANRVSRLTLVQGVLTNETSLLENIPGSSNHNGCRVDFGPVDGKLYVTMGDASEATLAQDSNSLAGKILRMNPDGTAPNDNPFQGTAGRFIYSLGHRNPQGLDWHPQTQEPFVSEHGPDRDDEINHVKKGANYGWPQYRGAPHVPGFEDAIYGWTPTIAPAGTVFYDRTEIPGWRGSMLLVTLKERDLRRLVPTDNAFSAVAREVVMFDGRFGRLRALRVGPDGWLYVGTSNRDGRGDNSADRVLRIRFAP